MFASRSNSNVNLIGPNDDDNREESSNNPKFLNSRFLFVVFSSGCCSAFQHGYQMGVTNNPQVKYAGITGEFWSHSQRKN